MGLLPTVAPAGPMHAGSYRVDIPRGRCICSDRLIRRSVRYRAATEKKPQASWRVEVPLKQDHPSVSMSRGANPSVKDSLHINTSPTT